MPEEDKKIPNNSEIDQALREFEAQSQGIPVSNNLAGGEKKVEGVSFGTGALRAPDFYAGTENSRMVRLVMKCSGGLVKDDKQAQYVLLGIAATMFLLSFYFFFDAFRSPSVPAGEDAIFFDELAGQDGFF